MQLENNNCGNYDPKRKCLKLWQHKAKYINFSSFALAKLHPNKVRSVVKWGMVLVKRMITSVSLCLCRSFSLCVSPALRVAAKKPVDKALALGSRCWGVRVPSIGQRFTNGHSKKKKKEKRERKKEIGKKKLILENHTCMASLKRTHPMNTHTQ